MTERFERAQRVIPGGASSPARAFGAVGGEPVFAAAGDGAYLIDADGHRYVDYIQGFGAIILGHAAVGRDIAEAARLGAAFGLTTEAEVELAETVVESVPSIERVRFLASGTEAGMTAARIARAATGRVVLVKFEGGYHGHSDAFLAKAGSGVATYGIPGTKGVPSDSVRHTIVLPYNDVDGLRSVFAERGDEIAAVFVEPIATNMGVVPPEPGFLPSLLALCTEHGALSVFDEVVTGFRVGMGGVQGAQGFVPDLTMLGKVLGGGLPVGAVGGRAEIMELLAPTGPVYQAGTFAAHPHAMAAGLGVLRRLSASLFASLEASAADLADGLGRAAKDAGALAAIVRAGPIVSVFFTAEAPRSFADVDGSDRDAFARFHTALRARGVLIAPSPFETWFPSAAHGAEEIERTIEAAHAAFAATRS
ncbi:MAG: glutamate-1-semialdehyde 2,1-aminomutase [Actinomycetota bacterium]